MKHAAPVLALALLGVCASGLISCAGDKIKGPQPPVTVLKSEPIAPQTGAAAVPAVSAASQAGPGPKTTNAAIPASPFIQSVYSTAVLSAPPALNPFTAVFSENDWFWIFLLLALLLLLASVKELESRRKNRAAAKKAILALPMAVSPVNSAVLALSVKYVGPLVHYVNPRKEVAVTTFAWDRKHKMHFSRWTTIKKVTAWAVYQCEISDQDAPNVYLTLHEDITPLTLTAHVGHFVPHDKNHLELDVKRLPGLPGEARGFGLPE